MTRSAAALAVYILFALGTGRAETWPPPMPDLAVTVLPESGECVEAEECRYVIYVANEGTAAFEGKVEFFHQATVPGVPASTASCRRRDFNSFTCETPLKLAAHAATSIAVSVRMLATPRSEAEHCVSLKTKDGDPVSANDRSCATVRVGIVQEQSTCEPGQALVNDRCYDLAKFCTGGRSFDEARQSCSCPAGRPVFDRAAGSCAVSLAALECSGGRRDFEGGCYCPDDKPVWDRATSSCRTEAEPQAVAVAPPAVVKPKVTIPAVPKPAAVRVAQVRKQAPAAAAKEAAQRTPRARPKALRVAAAPPVKCLPLWKMTRYGYCWPGFWVSPDAFSEVLRR